ncbi:uncharacterized protein HKW66_Vig0168010 [Vigna angularis]|uniref:Uncharacterized protein n=1 Tax=Phaseolus angularis TaxID=3914 RepID=A0A8T0JP30_PHAAN|nr:uncharacterized protein HKW66_Vig0167940 [Vigna angularis]KAG2380022.1 uncharacterized protein HKW66_Vig0168010 [Vigna angularis]
MQNGKPGGEVAEEKNNEEAEERGDATLKREFTLHTIDVFHNGWDGRPEGVDGGLKECSGQEEQFFAEKLRCDGAVSSDYEDLKVSQLEYLQIHDSVAEVLQKMTNIAGK